MKISLKVFILTGLFGFLAITAFSQATDSLKISSPDTLPKKSLYVRYIKLDDGDSVPVVNLPSVDIIDSLNPVVVDNMKRYLKLKRDVIRAYPYAKLAAATLSAMNDSLSKISKNRQRKKYIKESEKILKARFEKELKKLTVNQGRVLIKLVDRETGDSSYEIVKEMRGPFEAFFWQTLAGFWGSSLKSKYDPDGEDQLIENIVLAIERGEIPVQKK